jgi:hypothetical protein
MKVNLDLLTLDRSEYLVWRTREKQRGRKVKNMKCEGQMVEMRWAEIVCCEKEDGIMRE